MKARTGAITTIGAVLFANGLIIGTPWMVDGFVSGDQSFVESVADWRYVAFNYIYLAALIALVALAPSLRTWTGPTGRRLSGWTIPLLAAVAALQACTLFTQAVVTPFLLEVAPVALETQDGGTFQVVMTSIWIAWIAVLCLVAINGWSRRVFPIPAAILLIVGAVVIPVFGPAGSILVGAALAWAALARRRIPVASPEPALA
ncbi:hypothetical protein [Glaciibacter superstes]|uniref:hypothetical protein n=1 Tax=Glaciibacter superstes TaxID=501023 RepID=UPI0003B4E86F|nr:hypothetical protein [Glaciibacter superstes]